MVQKIPVIVENSIPTAIVVEWVFKALITALFGIGVRYIGGMKKSVDILNVKIAVMVERVQSHEKRISNLERTDKKAK